MPGAFDLHYLLVENVFGNYIFTALGLCIAYILIAMLGRISGIFIIWFLLFFLMVFSVGIWGDFLALIVFVVALAYFFTSLFRAIRRLSGD